MTTVPALAQPRPVSVPASVPIDIALLGWVRNLVGFYGAGELVDYASLTNVPAWLDRGLARPAVQRGLEIPKWP